jgi:ABC-type polar amino acid transport system ATPase subunit
MLDSITLKFTNSADLLLSASGITIFVGPNNSGKSLVLREVEQALTVHPFPAGLRILKDYNVKWPSIEEGEAIFSALAESPPTGIAEDRVIITRINPSGGVENGSFDKTSFLNVLTNKTDKHWWATQFLRFGFLRLDGRSRFNLTNDQQAGDLTAKPQNMLAHLFQNDAARNKVRSIVKDAFGLTFVVDPTHLGQLRIRLSREAALDDEQSLNERARKFHGEATYIKDASDGVQAFTGIITAVLSGEFHTILVDEPEAFLHPPLARKLGRHLGVLSTERGGTMLASTHSSDFLMGCIQATKDVRVVRLEYSEGKSKGRMVDPVELETMFKSPLMRSANAISSLFYDGVVVTESDNDRAFYGEIYYRLSAVRDDVPSILFINAQNKQTIKDIIGPLRKFGVPAAAIPDIDVVKDGGKTWTEWLQSAQIPSALHSSYQAMRTTIKSLLEGAGKDMKIDGGVSILSTQDQAAAHTLFDSLDEYGVFAVRRGEVENWLPELKIPGKKTEWTVAMLERLGSDPLDKNYIKPGTDDVWEFVSKIISWISNAARKGTL